MIYLDNCATTEVDEDVAYAAFEMMREFYGNPSSPYGLGRTALRKITEARHQVAQVIGAPTERLFFTSGGTEANNLALQGTLAALEKKGRIITTTIEHASVLDTCKYLKGQGYDVVFVSPRNGRIHAEDIIDAVDENTQIVSVMAVNNETGEILPIQKIAQGIKAKNLKVLFHCDCVQAYGKLPLNLNDIPIDLISMSAHKIYAPKGCGALYIRDKIPFVPLVYGGKQESMTRPGTENSAGIAAFGKAANNALRNIRRDWDYVTELNQYLRQELKSIEGAVINSPEDGMPYVLNISLPILTTEEWLHVFRMNNICISGSSACGRGEKSRVIKEMGITGRRADSVLRIGLGKKNTKEELDVFMNLIKNIYKERNLNYEQNQ